MQREVVFGITGSIAAYKAIDVISQLRKQDIGVTCVLTEHARAFVTTTTLETISGRPVVCELFPERISLQWDVEHIALADKADCVVIAPATANIIAKVALGLCDDFLSTMVLATRAPILIVPAMNEAMYCNPVTQDNCAKLRARGVHILEPATGHLACGTSGIGRFPERDVVLKAILSLLHQKHTP